MCVAASSNSTVPPRASNPTKTRIGSPKGCSCHHPKRCQCVRLKRRNALQDICIAKILVFLPQVALSCTGRETMLLVYRFNDILASTREEYEQAHLFRSMLLAWQNQRAAAKSSSALRTSGLSVIACSSSRPYQWAAAISLGRSVRVTFVSSLRENR